VEETVPTPWLMETDVAPVTFHDSVAELPEVMEVGLAVKTAMVGGPATVIVADFVDGPVEFVAVIV